MVATLPLLPQSPLLFFQKKMVLWTRVQWLPLATQMKIISISTQMMKLTQQLKILKPLVLPKNSLHQV